MRLSTIALIVTFALGMLIASVTSQAGQAAKVKRVGLLHPGSSPFPCDWKQRSPFTHRLRELGWVEGQNLVVEERWAEGRLDRLPELAAELVRLKVDVLLAGPPPAVHVLKRATSTIPIVMLAGDAVAEGLIESVVRPGGNITGLTLYGLELIGKRLELLKQAVPKLSRLAVLASAAMLDRTATAPYQVYWQELEAAAHLPPKVAAFSGTWEGTWGDGTPSRLVVESINAASACVVFAWAEPPGTLFRGEWVRGKAKVLPGGRLEMVAGPGLIFSFTMAKDHMSISGERAETRHMGAQLAVVTMKKVGP